MGLYTPTAVALPAQVARPEDGEAPTGAILGGTDEVALDAIKRLQDGELLTTEPAEGVLRWRLAGGLLGGLRRRHIIMVDDIDTTLTWDGLNCDVMHYPGEQETATGRFLVLPWPGAYSGGALALEGREWRVCRHAKDQYPGTWQHLTIRGVIDGIGTEETLANFSLVDEGALKYSGHVDLIVTSGKWRVIGTGGTGREHPGPTIEIPIPIEAQP